MTKNPTIGGIDARLWIGRPIKFKDASAYGPHYCRARLVAVDGKYAVVLPVNHRKNEKVSLNCVVPWWAMNPDLKALAEKESTQ